MNYKYKNGDFIGYIILKANTSVELEIPYSDRHFLFKQKMGLGTIHLFELYSVQHVVTPFKLLIEFEW